MNATFVPATGWWLSYVEDMDADISVPVVHARIISWVFDDDTDGVRYSDRFAFIENRNEGPPLLIKLTGDQVEGTVYNLPQYENMHSDSPYAV